jgi:hypothetical protein
MGAVSAARLVRGKEVRVELLVYLHHLLTGEAAAGGEFGDRFEVVIMSTRQGQVEHTPCRVADILEAVHDVARDEDDGAGAGRRGLVTDGQLIGALDDEEYFLLPRRPQPRRFSHLLGTGRSGPSLATTATCRCELAATSIREV